MHRLHATAGTPVGDLGVSVPPYAVYEVESIDLVPLSRDAPHRHIVLLTHARGVPRPYYIVFFTARMGVPRPYHAHRVLTERMGHAPIISRTLPHAWPRPYYIVFLTARAGVPRPYYVTSCPLPHTRATPLLRRVPYRTHGCVDRRKGCVLPYLPPHGATAGGHADHAPITPATLQAAPGMGNRVNTFDPYTA